MDLGDAAGIVADAYTVRGSVVLTPTGSVIKVGHEKFLLVISVSGKKVHTCVVNTDKNRYAPAGSQVKIAPDDVSDVSGKKTLTHDSYVDCSKVVDMGEDEFRKAVIAGDFKPKGHLGADAMAYVQNAGLSCPSLKNFEKKYFE